MSFVEKTECQTLVVLPSHRSIGSQTDLQVSLHRAHCLKPGKFCLTSADYRRYIVKLPQGSDRKDTFVRYRVRLHSIGVTTQWRMCCFPRTSTGSLPAQVPSLDHCLRG